MLKAIFNWFTNRNPHPNALAPATAPEAAPYKVEPPQPIVPTTSAEPVNHWPFPAANSPAVQATAAKEKTARPKKATAKPKTESKPAKAATTKKPRTKKSS